MNLTEEIIKDAHEHWQDTGKAPDTLKITHELWAQLKQEADNHKMLVSDPDELSFNGMRVTLVDDNTFLRYAMQ